MSFGVCWVSLNLFGASSGGLGSSLDGLGVSLRYLKTSFGALGAYLELSWSVFESSWGLFGGSWMRLGSSSGALEDVFSLGKPLFSKMSVSFLREPTFGTLAALSADPAETVAAAAARTPPAHAPGARMTVVYTNSLKSAFSPSESVGDREGHGAESAWGAKV